MKQKFGLSTLLISLVFILAATAGCSASPAGTPQPDIPPVKASGGTIAEAQVVPIQSATLSFASTGTVAEIVVPEGKMVKTGDVIARLKGTERAQAAVTTAELELLTAQQALDTLNRNYNEALAAAQLKLADGEKALDTAKKTRSYKDYTVGTQDQIDIARAEYIVAQDYVKQAESTYNMLADRAEDDLTRAAALTQVAQLRTIRDRALRNLNYLLSKPEKLEVGVAEGELKVAQATVDAAKRDLEKLAKGPDPDQLALIQARIKNAQAQVQSAKTAYNDLTLTAPFDGLVASNNLHVGEFTSPGTSTVTLADISLWKIETTDLTELNVVKFEEGSPVKITFDALPDLELSGKVERIKTIGQNKQGDITYTVVIVLDQQDSRLRWNMTASATFEK